MTLKEFYERLLILQYYNQPKAKAEIGLKAGYYQALKDFIDSLKLAFELDNAVDDRLDKIGKLVGLSRIVPLAVQKRLFGFDNNPNSIGFASKFDETRHGAPFSSKFTPDYTGTQLSNFDYRTLIKAKIAKNTGRSVMTGSDTSIGIQDVIQELFDGDGVVIDNKDMSLDLLLPYGFDIERLRIVVNSDLLPRAQGVDYKVYYTAESGSFGFDVNSNANGFASKFDSNYTGGKFARKLML